MRVRTRRLATLIALSPLAFTAALPGTALASGGGTNVVVLVDPDDLADVRVAEHYAALRNVPDRNLVVMEAGAADLAALHTWQIPALLGELSARGIDDHVDIVALGTGSPFFVNAPALIDAGGCPAAVSRIALASAYGLAYEGQEILAGGLTVHEPNRYYSTSDTPTAFDSRTRWDQGVPSNAPNARRYLVGMALGYGGPLGNTVTETLAMIDRSVAADASRPDGTFYFMDTPDNVRTAPRRFQFSLATSALRALGAKAEILSGIIPEGRHDALGILTGYADPPVETADFTLLPGSYADHLTSYGATFDTGSQVKISAWIRRGASGADGTVEEPCAIAAKFANARLFVWTYQGMALGEALFRSLGAAPFHGMAYGDPLVQPFARRPLVAATFPAEVASGLATVPVSATMPGGVIDRIELYVDGVVAGGLGGDATETLAGDVAFDTTVFADGQHNLSAVAIEGSSVRAQAVVTGHATVDNRGRGHAVGIEVLGDDGPFLRAHVTSPGAIEIRLLRGLRVVAAAAGGDVTLPIPRGYPGAPVPLTAEAEFGDGHVAVAHHVGTADRTISGTYHPPLESYGFSADVVPGLKQLLALPYSVPDPDSAAAAVVEVLSGPANGVLHTEGGTTYLDVPPGVAGTDHLTFRAVQGLSVSEPVTATLRYCPAAALVHQRLQATTCVGGSAHLLVEAEGQGNTYQWSRNGHPIAGATRPRLVLTNVTSGDAGTYEVTVRHWCRRVAHARTLVGSVGVSASPCRHSVFLPIGYAP